MTFVSIPNLFPNSTDTPFLATSPKSSSYNCIAWAYGDNTRWYWPIPQNSCFWPSGAPRVLNLNSFILLFQTINYEICENGIHEVELEKIAIFTDKDGIPTHAARQLRNGFWTSKLGEDIDVQHTIEAMENGFYGNANTYMSRIINL